MRYAYACITDNCIRTMEETMLKRKYQKLTEVATALEIKNVVIDICSSYKRAKPNLDKITSKKGNIVVMPDISCLGAKNEIASVYQQIVKSGTGILIAYYDMHGLMVADELSTVDLSFNIVDFSLEKNIEKINKLSAHEIVVESWKKVGPSLIEAYWKVEKREKTLREALKEINISKNTFNRKIKDYVGSPAWADAVLKFELDIKNHPTTLSDITEDGIKMYEYLQKNPSDLDIYGDLSIIASFAGIAPDLWERSLEQEEETPQEELARVSAAKGYAALAIWAYRDSLRYAKYLKNLKYRKDKK